MDQTNIVVGPLGTIVSLEDTYAADFEPYFCDKCGTWKIRSEDEVRFLAHFERSRP